MKFSKNIALALLLAMFVCASVVGVFPVEVYSTGDIPSGNNGAGRVDMSDDSIDGNDENTNEDTVESLKEEIDSLISDFNDYKAEYEHKLDELTKDYEKKSEELTEKLADIEKRMSALISGYLPVTENTVSAITTEVSEDTTVSEPVSGDVLAESEVVNDNDSNTGFKIIIAVLVIIVFVAAIVLVLAFIHPDLIVDCVKKVKNITGGLFKKNNQGYHETGNGHGDNAHQKSQGVVGYNNVSAANERVNDSDTSDVIRQLDQQNSRPVQQTPVQAPQRVAPTKTTVNQDADNEKRASHYAMRSYSGNMGVNDYDNWNWYECDDDVLAGLIRRHDDGVPVFDEYLVTPISNAKGFYQYALFYKKYLCPSFYSYDETTGYGYSSDKLMKVFVAQAQKAHMDYIFDFLDSNGNRLELNDGLIKRKIIGITPAIVTENKSNPDTYTIEKCGTIVFSNL